MSDYMKNQGLVDGITGCRNRQRELAKENKRLINVVVTYEAEIERLQAVVDAAQQLVEQGLSKRTTRDQWNAWHILKDALEDNDE